MRLTVGRTCRCRIFSPTSAVTATGELRPPNAKQYCIRRAVKPDAEIKSRLSRSFLGSALVALCGVVLWTPLGDSWVNASYDYLFRFGPRAPTNDVTVILMDNDAYDQLGQKRDQPWDRALHTRLLTRLAADGCSLVVFDSLFEERREPATDAAFADAMRRQKGVVLAAEQAELAHTAFVGGRPTLPCEPFLSAAGRNWGVAWLCPDPDLVVRRHWPFPAPEAYPSLPWSAALLAGARLGNEPQAQWLRYYGRDGAFTCLGYRYALAQPNKYFHKQIVFIGNQPSSKLGTGEPDQFKTPYTRWTGESVGGVEILATAFLNLVNGDWLWRPAPWMEFLVILAFGALLGGTLCRLRPSVACVGGAAGALFVALGAMSLSHFTNYWFPWLIVSGGQVPCALAWTLGSWTLQRIRSREPVVIFRPSPRSGAAGALFLERPNTPGYQLFDPPFGQGTYGKVWVALRADGQWRALKAVHLARFNCDAAPYEREFKGVRRYQPISDKHPGLLRVDFVSEKGPDYFYYVMELGDPIRPGWQQEPSTYRPRDLTHMRAQGAVEKLSPGECLRIGLAICEALEFLHRQKLTHRDIKPQNIIFVNGQPKLGDAGLVSEIRLPDECGTIVGTPGYMPPPPERPGTAQADIYSLGVVLYVLSTGEPAASFPSMSTTLAEGNNLAAVLLNDIINKACQLDLNERYASAADMCSALRKARETVERAV